MNTRMILARRTPPAVTERAKVEFGAIVAEDHDFTIDETLKLLTEYQAQALVMTSGFKLDRATIARLPAQVKIAATVSVGFDHIDVAAAKERGLIVTNTPEVLTDCTADLAFMLILAACRRAHEYDAIMRAGWRRKFGMGEMLGRQASNRTLGIFGLGRIGRAVAQRARGFNMRVLYTDAARLPPELEQGAQYFPDLRSMLPHCEILSLHAPGTPDTAKIMNAETFALLPKGAIFVNAARGALVDEDALLAALKSGHIAAAGLDVFHNEPEFDTRFAALQNVFLTPHMASATVETRNAMGFRALDNVAAVLAGKKPIDPLWS